MWIVINQLYIFKLNFKQLTLAREYIPDATNQISEHNMSLSYMEPVTYFSGFFYFERLDLAVMNAVAEKFACLAVEHCSEQMVASRGDSANSESEVDGHCPHHSGFEKNRLEIVR